MGIASYTGEIRNYTPNAKYPAEVSSLSCQEGSFRARQWASSKKGYHVNYEGCSYSLFFWLDKHKDLYAIEENTDKIVLECWNLNQELVRQEKELVNAVMRQLSCLGKITDEKVKKCLDAREEPTPYVRKTREKVVWKGTLPDTDITMSLESDRKLKCKIVLRSFKKDDDKEEIKEVRGRILTFSHLPKQKFIVFKEHGSWNVTECLTGFECGGAYAKSLEEFFDKYLESASQMRLFRDKERFFRAIRSVYDSGSETLKKVMDDNMATIFNGNYFD